MKAGTSSKSLNTIIRLDEESNTLDNGVDDESTEDTHSKRAQKEKSKFCSGSTTVIGQSTKLMVCC